jgi:hypothetical protein
MFRKCLHPICLIIALLPLQLRADDPKEIKPLIERIERLETQLKVAESERDHLQSQLDTLADQLNDDKRAKDSSNSEDQFSVGVRWQGSRKFLQPGAGKDFANWSLIITKRSRQTFEGEIHFVTIDRQPQVLTVSGVAPQGLSGAVRFKTNQKGILEQSFTGVLKGGQLSLTFSGTSLSGARVFGTANLKK